MKKVAGAFMLLLALVLLGWIGYNFLVEMQPEAQGRSPLSPLLFSAALIYVGVKWLRGKKAE